MPYLCLNAFSRKELRLASRLLSWQDIAPASTPLPVARYAHDVLINAARLAGARTASDTPLGRNPIVDLLNRASKGIPADRNVWSTDSRTVALRALKHTVDVYPQYERYGSLSRCAEAVKQNRFDVEQLLSLAAGALARWIRFYDRHNANS